MTGTNKTLDRLRRHAFIVLRRPTRILVKTFITPLLFEVRKQGNQPTQTLVGSQTRLSHRAARQRIVLIAVIVQRQNELLQIIATLRTRSGLAYTSHRRQRQADYSND